MQKVYGSAAQALEGLLFDGMLIASGGFGLCGIPELCIAAIRRPIPKSVSGRGLALGGQGNTCKK